MHLRNKIHRPHIASRCSSQSTSSLDKHHVTSFTPGMDDNPIKWTLYQICIKEDMNDIVMINYCVRTILHHTTKVPSSSVFAAIMGVVTDHKLCWKPQNIHFRGRVCRVGLGIGMS